MVLIGTNPHLRSRSRHQVFRIDHSTQPEVRLVSVGYVMQLPLLLFVFGCVLVPESVSTTSQHLMSSIPTFPRRFFSLLYWQTYSSSGCCQPDSTREVFHNIPIHLEHGACPILIARLVLAFHAEVIQLPLQRVRMRWQWSHALLTLLLTAAELLRSILEISSTVGSIVAMSTGGT